MSARYLACDLGAESGRLVAGVLDADRIELRELHRFPNTPVSGPQGLCWDVEALFAELVRGLGRAGARGESFASLSTDSWGVDYMLFDSAGQVLAPVYHYRDGRTARGVEAAHARMAPREIFEETGIQFMALNTLYQLAAESSARLDQAAFLLGIGDGFNYLLGGAARIEESMASTFQLYDPRARAWSLRVLEAVGIPARLLGQVVPSGSRLGRLKTALARQCGLAEIEVIASCSHDTGAAVAAVPARPGSWAYLSSGTWSLMGVELEQPILSAECRELNFTNEIGYGGSIRLLKNIVGLWILQECRREFEARGLELGYEELARAAESARPFRSLINPRDARFIAPGGMAEKIAAYCRETRQPEPVEPGAIARCAFESLALEYRRTLRHLERVAGRALERLHVVGGGSRNALLNQFTANALGLPVLAGPTEATALGNIVIQALTLGHLTSLAAAREMVGRSFPIREYEPAEAALWSEAYAKFESLP